MPVREFVKLIETRVYVFALRLIQLTIDTFSLQTMTARGVRTFSFHISYSVFLFSVHKHTTDPKGESLKKTFFLRSELRSIISFSITHVQSHTIPLIQRKQKWKKSKVFKC